MRVPIRRPAKLVIYRDFENEPCRTCSAPTDNMPRVPYVEEVTGRPLDGPFCSKGCAEYAMREMGYDVPTASA